ncbi:HU family DNA-binding protein [uncultured Brevundimonas sp.]|uniref:HU family DNA-binding protein n=1 Tax=uncultured Brevundimonas sp. TaxID=213418 RepID=UPI00344F1523
MVRIPFLSKSADRESLARCLDISAERSGVGADAAVRVMSLFFEAVADEITKGRAVRIPGFGVFVPAPIPERHRRASRNPTPRCKPVFSPSRGLRAQVALGVGPRPENIKALARHRSNHANSTGTQRVFTAMQALRQQVAAQLGRAGA